MATTTKQWDNGDSITFTYNGEGDGSVSIESVTNEGIDRSMDISVSNTRGSPAIVRTVSILQYGMREEFRASDGSFILNDGGTFNVLKE